MDTRTESFASHHPVSSPEIRKRGLRIVNTLLRLSLEDRHMESFLEASLREILSIPWLPIEAKGGIFLTENDGRTLRLRVHEHLPEFQLGTCEHVPFGRCLCGRAAEHCELLHAPCVDARHEIRYAGMPPHGHYCVPIALGERVLGVVVLYLPEGHIASEEDRTFLLAAASALALGIERRQIEQSRLEREGLFCSVCKAAQDAIIILHEDGAVVFWNESAERIFGYTSYEAVGSELALLVVPERYREAHRRGVRRFAAGGAVSSSAGRVLEYTALRKDGSEIPVEMTLAKIHADGVWQAIGVVRDVSERVEALRSLRTLSRAVEQSPNSIIITDPEGTIEYVNPTFSKITGYQPADVLGKNPRLLQSGGTSRGIYADLWATIRSGQTWHGEITNKKKDGTKFLNCVCISPVTNEEGHVVNFLAIQTDITEQRQAEEQARRDREELANVNRIVSMGELATALAHDLNQPLSAVVSYTQGAVRRLRSRSLQPAELLDVLEETTILARHAADLVKGIRTSLAAHRDAWTSLDINDLAQSSALLVRGKLQQHGATVALHLMQGLPPVSGSRVQIQQVMVNLILNAIEAMGDTPPEDRELTIGTGADDERVMHVTVEDNGMGLSEEVAASLFRPFFTTKPNGLGMGLAICRSITEAHGGRLWASNNPWGGTTFHLDLPVTETHAR